VLLNGGDFVMRGSRSEILNSLMIHTHHWKSCIWGVWFMFRRHLDTVCYLWTITTLISL
jgi:hypothetical protein